MNHKRLILITACCILAAVGGLSMQSFAGSESKTNAQAERHLEKANELRKVADHDGAIGEYEKVISLSPNTDIAINARYWIGQSHFQAGRLDAALAAFQTLVDEHPKSKVIASTKQMIERIEQLKKEKTLVEAIKNGDLEQLKSLISSGVDVNSKVKAEVPINDGTWEGEAWTLLNLALKLRKTDVATFLINNGADVNGRDGFDNHKTPLHYVAHRGTAALAKLLIAKGADVNAREDGDYTPLHCVTSDQNPDRDDQLEVARLLISNGANIESLDGGHRTPLWCAAGNGRLDIVELLISKGADIETRFRKDGSTPLFEAARYGHTEVVKLLLDKGASVNAKNDFDASALTWAIQRGNRDMVELLLAHNANLAHRHHGLNAIGKAMWSNQKEMVKLFIEKGVRHSPVHIAAFFGEIDKVKSYLAAGGDINAQDPSGQYTLLFCAMLGGQKEEMEFLISKGADLNLQDSEGFTVLHHVSHAFPNETPLRISDIAIAKMLIDNGADLTIKDDYGSLALHRALFQSRKEIVEMILDKGVDVNSVGPPGWRPVWWPSNDVPRGALLLMVCANLNRRGGGNQKAKEEMVKLLVEKGADVNVKGLRGMTPLGLLKKGGHEELVELLRKHGAKE